MILAISTSSPVTSIALLTEQGDVVVAGSAPGGYNASGVVIQLIQELEVDIKQVNCFVANVGPGSFIGSRVAVTLAKTMAFAQGSLVAGVLSFDLISPSRVVAFPSKKGEWFIRRPGETPYRTQERPEEAIGFGPGFLTELFPDAANARLMLPLKTMRPQELLPEYFIEPSISTPRRATTFPVKE